MNVSSIFTKVQKCSSIRLNNSKDKSIGFIEEDIFYIEPLFKEIQYVMDNDVIVFSAPGATGKSTLAKKVAYKYNALYWDLSKIKLGDNSFVGTLYKSVDDMQQYLNNLKSGKVFLVIDAFDEAILTSGKNSVMDFLNDIAEVCHKRHDASCFSFVILARTETAREIIQLCTNEKIKYSHFEIGFISEENAKQFILEKLNQKRNSNVEQCINEQFALIGRVLCDEEVKRSFIGYPPVLETLSKAYDSENNTIKLLNRLVKDGVNEGSKVIYDIIKELTIREQNKVVDALKERWKSKFPEFNDWDKVYTTYEQLVRVIEFIDIGSNDLFINDFITEDMKYDYDEAINSFLVEHPFLINTVEEHIDFASPAFRDYTLALLLNDESFGEFVYEYNLVKSKERNVPSQLFFDFFVMNPKAKMHGKDFPILYDAFKAKESMQYECKCKVSGDDEGLSASFEVMNKDSVLSVKCIEMYHNEPIVITKLIDSSIMFDGMICLGKDSSSVEIANSYIECSELKINSKEVYIKSTKVGGVYISSKGDVMVENDKHPQIYIEFKTDEDIRIDIPNVDRYYQFSRFKYKSLEAGNERLMRFAAVVDKIFDCMRRHRKDAPAKDCEYVDNEIIANNEFKKKVIENLRRLNIIYIDSKEKHLYKLNLEELKQYGIGWQTLSSFGVEKFNELYIHCLWD